MSVWLGGNRELKCPPSSNLAKTSWLRDGHPLPSSPHHQLLPNSLLIFNASASDAARYHCVSLEQSHAGEYTTTVADYLLRIAAGSGRNPGDPTSPQAQTEAANLAALQASVGLLAIFLAALLVWNFYKGHLRLPCRVGRGARKEQSPSEPDQGTNVSTREEAEPGVAEVKSLVSHVNCSGNNNHAGVGGESPEGGASRVSLNSLQYIDESEM